MTTSPRRRGAPPAGERLTRDAVLDAASDLIERDGVGPFSLRSLAKELTVRPAALYNHVNGLDDLLDAVAGRFLAGFDLADTEGPWPDRVRGAASQLRDRMFAQPELTDLVLSRAPTVAAGPALLRQFEKILIAAGVPDAVAHLAWHVVLTVVIGSLRQERARNRNQTDTFDAVLEVAVAGLLVVAAGPLDARPLVLLESHHGER